MGYPAFLLISCWLDIFVGLEVRTIMQQKQQSLLLQDQSLDILRLVHLIKTQLFFPILNHSSLHGVRIIVQRFKIIFSSLCLPTCLQDLIPMVVRGYNYLEHLVNLFPPKKYVLLRSFCFLVFSMLGSVEWKKKMIFYLFYLSHPF